MAVRTAIDDVLEEAVVDGRVPGVVALAADASGIIYAGAFGKSELGADADISLDTVFYIASMTKAVTSVAAMQLVEQGRLDLDEPIDAHLPDLAELDVLEGYTPEGTPILRARHRPITARHLLTHTSGCSTPYWNQDMTRYLEQPGVIPMSSGKRVALRTPLVFDPGERWEYGTSTDWLGLLVEAISGKTLDVYCRDHICGPLGMTDTVFELDAGQQARLVSRHARQPDGSLEVVQLPPSPKPEFFRGGGGLFSTGPDYLTFTQMFTHGGTFRGAQILRPETVAEMGRNQIGDLTVPVMKTAAPAMSYDAEFFPGMPKKWGLGFLMNTEDAPTGRTANSLAWAGLVNTYYWIDPTTSVSGVILTQILPFADPIVLDLFGRFESAVYAEVTS